MPTTLEGWLFWIFTAVILAFLLTILSNLATPAIRRSGESWLQKRRLKREEYYEMIEKIALDLNENPTKVVLYYTVRLLRYGSIIFIFSFVASQIHQ